MQGKMYYFTIEVMENGVPKNYDAKVWVKPWEGYKELESFLPSAPSHYDSAVDSDAKSGVYDVLSYACFGSNASDFSTTLGTYASLSFF